MVEPADLPQTIPSGTSTVFRTVNRFLAFIAATSTSVIAATTNAPKATPPNSLVDIKGPLEIHSSVEILKLAVLAGGLLLLMALAWWLWRRRKPAVEPEIIVPPEVRARSRLREALEWLDQPERFCTAVSDIIRVYLEERFGLHAPDRTTEEFLSELAKSAALDSRHKALLAEFLTECDLVKFARVEPGRVALESLQASGLRLVDETAVAVRVLSGQTLPSLEPPPLTTANS